MKKISGSTFFFKKFFPSLWFGLLAVFLVLPFILGEEKAPIEFFAMCLFMAFSGLLFFKYLFWDLADEVYDEGESLLFRKGKQEQRVYLKDIININYAQLSAPERVVIDVRTEGSIGKALAFSPPPKFNPFSKSPIIAELIERVDRARGTIQDAAKRTAAPPLRCALGA